MTGRAEEKTSQTVTGPASGRYAVALFNSADPRGKKVGGIETYIRDYIFYHPADMDLLFIGADEIGDLPLGQISEVEFRGRKVKFLPLYFLENAVNNYTGTIAKSETMTFAKALLKNWGLIRNILRKGKYSVELRRPEYAPIIWSMGIPFIQMVHVWGAKDKQQSSVLGKYWYIRDATEMTAAALSKKFYSVNSDMTAMFKRRYKFMAGKFDTLTTWANTTIFRPTPFVFGDNINILYAGRMDKFKRPDIMFRVIAEVRRRAPNILFHYAGDGDVEQFPEFAAIADITVRHGVRTSPEIAELMRSMHVGILTSDFEGMPRFVMELLTSGRPAVALHLPQLESVIADGVSGFLIPRGEDQIVQQAEKILETYQLEHTGALTPETISRAVEPFSPQSLLGKIWKDHRWLHGIPA